MNLALRSLLVGNCGLLVHGRDDGNQEILASFEVLLDFGAHFTGRDLDVILRGAIRAHEIKEAVINVDELVFNTLDVGDVHVVSGRTDIFQFLVGEDVSSDEMNLRVTMLSSLGRGHINDLARPALDHDVATLAESAALHRKGERGSGAGRLEGLIVLFIVTHNGRNGCWARKSRRRV